MRGGSFCDEGVVVDLAPGGDGVIDLDDSFLRYQDGAGSKCLMFDCVLLEMAQPYDAAGQDGPQFFFLELPFLSISLVDLVIEGPFCELEECKYFVEG